MKKFISSLMLMLFAAALFAQTQSGELSGKVTDESGEPIIGGTIVVKKNGVYFSNAQTDFDGFYTIKPLPPGKYDVEISYVGNAKFVSNGVVISADKITTLSTKLKSSTDLDEVVIVEYKVPLIDKDDVSTKQTISAEQIKSMPTRSISSIASTTAGVYQEDEKSGLNVKGSRTDGTEIYIDGIRVRGSSNLPANAIEQLTVITGGIPARYGDATGGIINITTKGPSKNYSGSLEAITSQFMDPVGYNLLNFSLTGPLYTKNKGTENEKSVVGFFLSGEYLREQDGFPAAKGVYRVKQDILEDLERNPLIAAEGSDALLAKAETLTRDDLELIKTKLNAANNNVTASGKLDFQVSENVQLTFGGSMNYNRYHDWIQRYSLMNWINNPLYDELTYRFFGRFTQRLGGKKQNAEDGAQSAPQKASVIQNAFYSVQFDYSKDFQKNRDETMGTNPFNYGHVGTFDIQSAPLFQYATAPDSASGKTGWQLQGFQDTLVNFTISEVNPEAGNYTRNYYELSGNNPDRYRSLDAISLGGGFVNGQRTPLAHGVWFPTGRQFNGYGTGRDNDQFRLFVSGAFDIVGKGKSATSRNKHAIELGIEFEQRVDRSYSIAPAAMWTAMRQLTNRHILELDRANPILLIDGQQYAFNDPNAPAFGQNDTILYDRKYNAEDQSYFDKQLRAKLGLAENSTEFINVDGLSPETFDLKMFSPDEILNQGSPYASYFGYDAYGNKLSGNVSFNDFFTKKDANGNYTREVGAYRPVYAAAFIQDKFTYKDILFNVGVRIDRFDANQKVLKDPYLLYQSFTAGEVRGQGNFEVPAAIGDDYYVYVDDFAAPSRVIGYRSNDTWFNEEGVEVIDPSVIARNSGNGRITPYLVNKGEDDIKSEDFDPNSSFEDYKPQIIVMPRVSFSFNLTDKASFFAHYDVLAQRPEGRIRTSPVDWFFLEQNVGGFINNPNLRAEKTIDYQVGFRNLLTSNSAVTISAFYRDLKDLVQVRAYNFAYPFNYFTFGNRDFGNVKGITVDYDMRKTATSNFSLKATYTMQFADGTGSDNASQANLIQAGSPNLRTVTPLNYDSRHLLTLSADYTYGRGKNYNGPKTKSGKQFLADAGINMIVRTRSGSPYTKQSNATPDAATGVTNRPILSGSLNGQRLPWNFRIDLRIHKDFQLTGKKEKTSVDGVVAKKKDPLFLNVYVLVQNILNKANVNSVYAYTGNPDDDGYLASVQGQQDVNGRQNPQSFFDLYSIYNQMGFNDNGGSDNTSINFSLPRQVRLGAVFTF